MAGRKGQTRLAAPFLRRVAWREPGAVRPEGYPFTLPFLQDPEWEWEFTAPVTILVGENGSGKSTLIEALAALAGYDEAGGSKGYAPVSHEGARDVSGAGLADHLRAGWLPKVTSGWFFRAETFWTVARYLDAADSPMADFLTQSHGEGFLQVFAERCRAQGLYLLDEPESALSPARQMDLLEMLADIQASARAQVIMATHSPMLMAVPGAQLLQVTRFGLEEVTLEQTRHFRILRAFCSDPKGYVEEDLAERRRRSEPDEG